MQLLLGEQQHGVCVWGRTRQQRAGGAFGELRARVPPMMHRTQLLGHAACHMHMSCARHQVSRAAARSAQHAVRAARDLAWQLVAKQPQVQRYGLEVPQVLAGAAHHDAQRVRALPQDGLVGLQDQGERPGRASEPGPHQAIASLVIQPLLAFQESYSSFRRFPKTAWSIVTSPMLMMPLVLVLYAVLDSRHGPAARRPRGLRSPRQVLS